MRTRLTVGITVFTFGLTLAGPLRAEEPDMAAPASPAPARVTPPGAEDYLQPNIEDHDGVGAYVHVTEADMPLRIAIGTPRVAARNASRTGTREAAIESIRLWEAAIQPHLPWFRLEFTEEDPGAPVQVEWKNRINGPWGGFGRVRYWRDEGRLRVGGAMQVSTTPRGSLGRDTTLTVRQVRRLIAHEFGHVLGLGHCLDCDSAMNYSWETEEELIVTELDARTFVALVAKPNGIRTDGRMLIAYRAGAGAGGDRAD